MVSLQHALVYTYKGNKYCCICLDSAMSTGMHPWVLPKVQDKLDFSKTAAFQHMCTKKCPAALPPGATLGADGDTATELAVAARARVDEFVAASNAARAGAAGGSNVAPAASRSSTAPSAWTQASLDDFTGFFAMDHEAYIASGAPKMMATPASASHQQACINTWTMLTAAANLPLSLCDHSITKTLFLQNGVTPPSVHMVTKALGKAHDKLVHAIKGAIGGKRFAVGFDTLTRYDQRFHGVVLYYMNEDMVTMSAHLIAVMWSRTSGTMRSEDLVDIVNDVVETQMELDLDKMVAIVTDGAADMIKMQRLLSEAFGVAKIPCISHYMAVALAESMAYKSNKEAAVVLYHARRLNNFVRNTPKMASLLTEIEEAIIANESDSDVGKFLDGKALKLLGSVITRWGSRVTSLERELNLLDPLRRSMESGKATAGAAKYQDSMKIVLKYEDELRAIVDMSEPIMECMVALQADKHPTLSTVAGHFWSIIKKLTGYDEIGQHNGDEIPMAEDEIEAKRAQLLAELAQRRVALLSSKAKRSGADGKHYVRRIHEIRTTKERGTEFQQCRVEWRDSPDPETFTWEPAQLKDEAWWRLYREHYEKKGTMDVTYSEQDDAVNDVYRKAARRLDEKAMKALARGQVGPLAEGDDETIYQYKKQENDACSKVKVPVGQSGTWRIASGVREHLIDRMLVHPLGAMAIGDISSAADSGKTLECAAVVAMALDPQCIDMAAELLLDDHDGSGVTTAVLCLTKFAIDLKIIDEAQTNKAFKEIVDAEASRPTATKRRRVVERATAVKKPPQSAPWEDKLTYVLDQDYFAFHGHLNTLKESVLQNTTTSYWAPVESTSLLKMIALAVFAIPATQASVERAFSIVSGILTPRRNRLLGTRVAQLTMLNWALNRRWGGENPFKLPEQNLEHLDTAIKGVDYDTGAMDFNHFDDLEDIDYGHVWGFSDL